MALTVSAQWPDRTLQVDVEIPTTGITALYGRSGSGKTSILRLIAGLDPLPNAKIYFDQQCWQDGHRRLPTEQRRIGLVMQQPSLFTHLSVLQNLLYGYKRQQHTLYKNALQLSPQQIIDCLELTPFLSTRCHELSGGQQQRVALGRALLSAPSLLLLDEPFASLDEQSKNQLIPLVSNLQKYFSIPVIMVSHDIREICALADHVIHLRDGSLKPVRTIADACADQVDPLFSNGLPATLLQGQWISKRDNIMDRDRIKEQSIPGYHYFSWGTNTDGNSANLIVSIWFPSSTVNQTRLVIKANDIRLAEQPAQQLSHEPHCTVIVHNTQRCQSYWLITLEVLANRALLYCVLNHDVAKLLDIYIGKELTAYYKITVFT